MNEIEYREEFGEIRFPDGFEQKLKGKTIEEQMALYRVTVETTLEKYSYGELDSRSVRRKTCTLEECPGLKDLIVQDGILVGVMLTTSPDGARACLPGQTVTTYSASDGDGTGSSDREDTCRLDCAV